MEIVIVQYSGCQGKKRETNHKLFEHIIGNLNTFNNKV